MPRLGGTLWLGLINGGQSKWPIDADRIEARYTGSAMAYIIHDELIGSGELQLELLHQRP
ncbi:MAG: DUF4450 domain-containing protein [Pontiellaceae bacterium]|nr:DUF4450 domain-containing protein [Pontiellaceae bacterium]MBN2785974.1 DUF4450 domain-containing protein [Pontiellaceae bacterium]